VVFADRESSVFDSPADLFRFLQNMARYDRKHGVADIGAVYLTDYAQGGWVEAKRAFVVAGSNVRGPMNNADLPAFGSQAAADAFAKANGGKVLAFAAVTAEVMATLASAGHGHEGHVH
jgi:nitrous oxide reductase accessory protein NosL